MEQPAPPVQSGRTVLTCVDPLCRAQKSRSPPLRVPYDGCALHPSGYRHRRPARRASDTWSGVLCSSQKRRLRDRPSLKAAGALHPAAWQRVPTCV